VSSAAVTQATGAPLVTLTTTAETAVITSGVLPYNAPGGQGVLVSGLVAGATGASVTSCQVRVYRGATTGGTQVGVTLQEAQGASSFYSMGFSILDTTPGANPQYTVSVQQVGATGNGTATIGSVALEAANAAGT
jgi:hypothetical protein